MSAATIERNDVHNYRTAVMSDVLGHEVCDAVHGLEADDPVKLEKTAASAVEAAGKLLSFHGQALLDQLPAVAA